jgi:hypothetical protein
MKPPEEPIRSQVASWLAKADDDYQLIEHLAAAVVMALLGR